MSEKKSFRYIPELDSIRGLFCFTVVLAHVPMIFAKIPIAWEVMQIFFVMSGYLITSILLKEKELPLKTYLKNFYVRRVLRIFPLYFFYVFLVWIIVFLLRDTEVIQKSRMMEEFKDYGVYLLTFTYNFREFIPLISGKESTVAPVLSHLWSISLEEQFYLVLPIVVYFLSRKQLKWAMIALIIFIPVLRVITFEWLSTYTSNKGEIALVIFHNSLLQSDAFAWGILMALLPFDKIRRPGLIGFVILVVLLLIIKIDAWFICKNQWGVKNPYIHLFKPELLGYNYQFSYALSILNFSIFLMILGIVQDKSRSRILSHPWSVYLGKISYGIYIYHFGLIIIMYVIFLIIYTKFPLLYKILDTFPGHWILFLIFSLVVVAVSHVSYKYFEVPFLRLKNRFR